MTCTARVGARVSQSCKGNNVVTPPREPLLQRKPTREHRHQAAHCHGYQRIRSGVASSGSSLRAQAADALVQAQPSENAGAEHSGRTEDGYVVSSSDKELFAQQGFVHLPAVMSEKEMLDSIDQVYDLFLTGKVIVPGKDLCDMSLGDDVARRTPDQFTLFNAMLPRQYYPEWQGNLFERRCKAIADQLQGGGMEVDYDQILAKRPHSMDAVFAWHQDMAYWPPFTSATATATCWLAVTDATLDNGCMRFLTGSHLEARLRPHAPVASSREESHALFTELLPSDRPVDVPLRRGDITVHNERVVHGSGPNRSAGWRKGYVLALRKAECVAEERRLGFTHSHNDAFNWDVFHQHRKSP